MLEQLEGSLRFTRECAGSAFAIVVGSGFIFLAFQFAPTEGAFGDGLDRNPFNEGFGSLLITGGLFLAGGVISLLRAIMRVKPVQPSQVRSGDGAGEATFDADAVIQRYLAQKSVPPKSSGAKLPQSDRPAFGRKQT